MTVVWHGSISAMAGLLGEGLCQEGQGDMAHCIMPVAMQQLVQRVRSLCSCCAFMFKGLQSLI